MRARRRRDHEIDALPDNQSAANEVLQPVLGGKAFGRRGRCAAGDDLPGDREHRLRMLVEELADAHVSFGDPRPLVEQARGFEERREIDLHTHRAKLLQLRHRLREQLFRFGIAEELQLVRPRHAHPATGKAGGQRVAAKRRAAGIGVGGVVPLSHLQDGGGVSRSQRKDGDAVERPARRDHPARAEQPAGRLHAEQVVERRWHAPGAGRIGPEGKTHQPRRHRHRRARTRAARHVFRVEAVAAGAVRRARSHEAGGKLVEVGLAYGDRTGVEQRLHYRCTGRRDVGKLRAGRRGGMAGEVDVVLDREGHAIQGEAGRSPALKLCRTLKQDFARQLVDPDVVAAACRDPCQDRLHHLSRARKALAQARAEAEKVETVCALGHGSRLFRASGTTSYPNRPE